MDTVSKYLYEDNEGNYCIDYERMKSSDDLFLRALAYAPASYKEASDEVSH
jgi:hypothetical protein